MKDPLSFLEAFAPSSELSHVKKGEEEEGGEEEEEDKEGENEDEEGEREQGDAQEDGEEEEEERNEHREDQDEEQDEEEEEQEEQNGSHEAATKHVRLPRQARLVLLTLSEVSICSFCALSVFCVYVQPVSALCCSAPSLLAHICVPLLSNKLDNVMRFIVKLSFSSLLSPSQLLHPPPRHPSSLCSNHVPSLFSASLLLAAP